MLDYNIRFTEQDVLRVLQDWQRQAKESHDAQTWQNSFIAHQLISSSEGPFQLHELVDIDRLKREQADPSLRQLVLEDLVQRGFVHNIASLAILYIHACREAVSGTAEGKGELKDLARNYYESISGLAAYMPITPLVAKLGPLTNIQRKFCERADVDAAILVYTGNSLFSPEFRREKYILEQDVSTFLSNVREILANDGIRIVFGRVYRIVTMVDYVANVIEPLVWNIRNHAFNPTNNIYNRPMDQEFSRYIQISGDSERVVETDGGGFSARRRPVPSGFFVVEVRDNGYGIREEDLPHIFEKNFSTKTNRSVQHGIGLYGVKSFVERHGGTISVESKLGRGTTFKFSVPYNSVRNHYCIQGELPVSESSPNV